MADDVIESGQSKNITATGIVKAGSLQLIGFYVNSTSSGTLVLRAGSAIGTVLCGTITPAIGFHRYPVECKGGLHATVGGTIDATFFYRCK
jgi:hypothetical protein